MSTLRATNFVTTRVTTAQGLLTTDQRQMTSDNKHPSISFHFLRFPRGSVPEGHRNDGTSSRPTTSAKGERNASLKKIEKGSVSQSGPLAPRVDKAIWPHPGFQT
jgi:hypothetical protein